jgi:hypothetical protein
MTRGGGGGPILTPMDTCAKVDPAKKNVNASSVFFILIAVARALPKYDRLGKSGA